MLWSTALHSRALFGIASVIFKAATSKNPQKKTQTTEIFKSLSGHTEPSILSVVVRLCFISRGLKILLVFPIVTKICSKPMLKQSVLTGLPLRKRIANYFGCSTPAALVPVCTKLSTLAKEFLWTISQEDDIDPV